MSAIYIENLTCNKCGKPFQGALGDYLPANIDRVATCPICFDKRSINLKFITYYPGGNTRTEMRFLPESSADLVVKRLLDQFFKAGHSSKEDYELFVERTGKTLSSTETLEEAEVQAGDTITLQIRTKMEKKFRYTCPNSECGHRWVITSEEIEKAELPIEVYCPLCNTRPELEPEIWHDGEWKHQKPRVSS